MTPAPALSTRAFLWRAALAALPSAADKATKAALMGVRVEPNPQGGIYLIASNEETTLILQDGEGWVERAATIRVSYGLFEQWRRESRRTLTADEMLQVNRGMASITDGAPAQEASEIRMPYPDMLAKLPDFACGWPPPTSIDADETLARIGRILSIAGPDGVARTGASNVEICVVRWRACPGAVALVTPCCERSEERFNRLDFLARKAPPLSMAAINRRQFGLRKRFEVVSNPDDAA